MYKQYHYFVFVLLLLNSCFSRSGSKYKEVANLKQELLTNFELHKSEFKDLEICFKFPTIRYIEFYDAEIVKIALYQDSFNWQKYEGKYSSTVLDSILLKNKISLNQLIKLKAKCAKLNINNLLILDLYDVIDGSHKKALELKFKKEANGLHYYYKYFQNPISTLDSAMFGLQVKDSIGGILDSNFIFYYR